MNGDIPTQVGFMHSAIGSQKITQPRPTAFIGIDVDFTNAIAVIIARPFIFSMTNRMSNALETIVTVVLVGVERRLFLRKPLDKWA